MTKSHPNPPLVVLQKPSMETSLKDVSPHSFLCSLAEFSKVPAEDLLPLANVSRLKNYKAGEYIVSEGDELGTRGYIVASGRIAVTKTSLSGKELIVELLQDADSFGLLLMLAIEKLPNQLSARALQDTTILWLPVKNFTELLTAHPILFNEFVAHLICCLQSSYQLARGLAHDRVEVRIATLLCALAIKFSEAKPAKEYTLHFTRQQIADLTGTTIETCIRSTRSMQREGLIDISHPGEIRITNLGALLELLDI